MGFKRNKWHLDVQDDSVTLSRHVPARFDFAAQTVLPRCGRVRLAHQIRQDMWRALKHLRGFSPVVHIRLQGDYLHVKAGGHILGPVPGSAVDAVQNVLDDAQNRARWTKWAKSAA